MDAQALALAFGVMLVGALLQGTIGFGANLFAAPLLVLIDPDLVPAPVIVAAVAMNVLVVRRDRHPGAWQEMRPAIAGQVAGAVAGAALLAALPTDRLAVLFAVVILVGVALSATGRHPRRTPATLATGGTAAGFMGTTTGIGGPPIALVLQDLGGVALRGSLARFFLTGAGVSLAALAVVGRLGWAELGAGLLLMPGVVAGIRLSSWVAPRVDHGHVRVAVLTLSAVSALVALARALL